MSTAYVQNHIHLDLPTNLSDPPENAPILAFTATERSVIYETYISQDRAWDGTELFSSMANSGGGLAIFKNAWYTLRVSQAQLESLEGLLLKVVSLVDNRHCANGLNHTGYIRTMRLVELKYVRPYSKLLDIHDVEINLVAIASS